MVAWGNPLTLLLGLLAMVLLSSAIVMKERGGDGSRAQLFLVVSVTGGLAAAILFFGMIVHQMIKAVVDAVISL